MPVHRLTSEISVVTPTFGRPVEIVGLLENLRGQTILPAELIIVDGAPPEDARTENIVRSSIDGLPFYCRYFRHNPGTSVQRNKGIDEARGDYIALIDDDIRLEPDFFESIVAVFERDGEKKIGGITGCITNQQVTPQTSLRWRWYKKLKLFTTYEPGRYDFQTGIPINRYLQKPHDIERELDFMGAGCAVWRREVFDSGLRFDTFFSDYGILEDAHLALRAGRRWKLLESGAARCIHLQSQGGRIESRSVGYKCVVNYYYVFQDLVHPLTIKHKYRFWRFQTFELFRVLSSAIRRNRRSDLMEFIGRVEGIIAIARGAY